MILDIHVHVSALTPDHGLMSDRLINSLPFRFMRWRLGIPGTDAATEKKIAHLLARTIDETPIDAAVILAFDAVYDGDGRLDQANTHLYVTNDYAIELCKDNPRMLFGASVHPYRKDAVPELERCVKAGAVLLKWLPIVQGFNPADPRCFPFYEALAHHKLPLLSHTGGESALPNIDVSVADPDLLKPALERGVTVIAAHCGTKSTLKETDFIPNFIRLVHQYENLYGDTAALSLPMRSYAYEAILKDPIVRDRLLHGSDWPIISLPPMMELGPLAAMGLMREKNWMKRDVLIKQKLGFDPAYWHRAAKVLRVEGRVTSGFDSSGPVPRNRPAHRSP